MTKLRPIFGTDIEFLDSQLESPEMSGEHGWFGFRLRGHVAEQVAKQETIRSDGGRLLVTDDADRRVGEVSWRITLNGPPPNGECWNIGIWIAPEARGQGHGSESQRLLAAYLFEHTKFERVEAGTETGNIGEQKALEKAGFTKEGVLRRACFRGGEWRDMVVYSKLRGEQ